MSKWTLVAGHVHLFHIVAPIIAKERNYFHEEGAGECDFLYSGSDAKTIAGMQEGRYHIGLDPKPFLLCGAKVHGEEPGSSHQFFSEAYPGLLLHEKSQ